MNKSLVYCIPVKDHAPEKIREILLAHPEIRFVSLVGVDIYGLDTDEKIPVNLLLKDVEGFLDEGVHTDGSSVLLTGIANITNARVDLIPDKHVNWYVDYNEDLYEPVGEGEETDFLPVGTLKIPSVLLHNGQTSVGSRSVLLKAERAFKANVFSILKDNPRILEAYGLTLDEVADIELTAATELEFYVRTPHEDAERDRLRTSQTMKEQYWKRTVGPVRTALEECILLLDSYGFNIEMGHKEVGGANPEMIQGGDFDHIMEQLEIDWKYSSPIQTADNEYQIKHIVEDVFKRQGLEVTFAAKPVEGIAGSGKHVHLGVAARLKNGKRKNLFSAADKDNFMNEIGFGALMGLLKNYEVINPIASCTIDAMNRLKPGYEAPVCIVTSLGHDVQTPSRNRTILVGLIRDENSDAATHFELRSPNAKSNTYLVLAACLQAMMDGIKACVGSGLSSKDLEHAISKKSGEEVFYLEKDREYRTEKNVFEEYTQEERNALFGNAPKTVWENLSAFDKYPEKTAILFEDGVMSKEQLESFKAIVLDLWTTEVQRRIIPEMREKVKSYRKLHDEGRYILDDFRWKEINDLRFEIAKDLDENRGSMLSQLRKLIKQRKDEEASSLLVDVQAKMELLDGKYVTYKRNIIEL